MSTPCFIVSAFSIAFLVPNAALVCAQNYPSKPVRMVTIAAGGASDFVARLITPGLSASLGQQVIVDNRASVVIAADTVSRSPPDGHTMLYFGSLLWLFPLMQGNASYDTLRDFIPVTMVVTSPNILVVHPSVAANSTRELIALAKAKPGELNYASGASGSSFHLAAELFNAMAGVNIVRIPYKAAGPAFAAMIGGEVQVMFPSAGGAVPHVKSGKLKALGVTSAQPSALLPGLPTVAASGLPGYEAVQMSGIFVAVKTPAALVARLNQEVVRIIARPEIKEQLLNSGSEVVGSSPEQFAAKIRSEIARMGKVIKDAGIRSE